MSWKSIWNKAKSVVRRVVRKTIQRIPVKIAAFALNMSYKDGGYHANYNCWQQYLSYLMSL